MNYNIITIFPELVKMFAKTGFIKRAIEKEYIDINIINLRDYSNNKHNRVDDKSYGGGPGMVMQYEPIYNSIKDIKKKGSVIYLSPQGKPLTQGKLKNLSLEDNLTILCGRYEGVDQRVIDNLIDDEVSIGDYVISGGESASMVLMEGITRLIPGVVDDIESINQDSFQAGILDHPHYTKPENIKGCGPTTQAGTDKERARYRALNLEPEISCGFEPLTLYPKRRLQTHPRTDGWRRLQERCYRP